MIGRRNEPCICGSGKKSKKCCGINSSKGGSPSIKRESTIEAPKSVRRSKKVDGFYNFGLGVLMANEMDKDRMIRANLRRNKVHKE